MIRYYTAGESHGKCLIAVVEGIPAGLKIDEEDINRELRRRQSGFGRGKRMDIEKDRVEILSGVRFGETIGSPISIMIRNKDWKNWKDTMSIPETHNLKAMESPLTHPRPGHADLAGALKFARSDVRDILERASARETAARVAAGAVCRKLLDIFGIGVISFTEAIGQVVSGITADNMGRIERMVLAVEKSPVRCPDREAEKKMMAEIEHAKTKGDTLGGIFCIAVCSPPPGLGGHTQWDVRLDGRLAQSVMSIQSVKGVEIGGGFTLAHKYGSQVHDEIYYRHAEGQRKGFYRKTNNAGGIEGGTSNGESIIIRAAVKPIPSLTRPLHSVDLITKKSVSAAAVRSDVCVVPAAGVIGEAVVCFEIARSIKEKFGGDTVLAMKSNYAAYLEYLRNF